MTRLLISVIIAMSISCCSRPVAPDTIIVAHRGASWYAPENTLPAFMLAWEQGADAIEGDFYITADGEIVCIHDPLTGRVAGPDLVVAESTLEQLRELDVGSWKNAEYAGTRIPVISEVFQIVPEGKKIFVEIKTGPEILPALYREVEQSNLSDDQIIIISFNSEVIRQVKTHRPVHQAYWLSGFREDEYGNISPDLDMILETLAHTGADGFSSNHRLVTREIIEGVMEAGYEYHVWTVNDAIIAQKFREYGARSITTDRPGYIRENLEAGSY
jgi:glycerophosphoryl diester phosphodiesterase